MKSDPQCNSRPLQRLLCSAAVAASFALGSTAIQAQTRVSGFVSETIAYTTADPTHWSRAVTRLQLTADGRLSERVKWRLGARLDVDPVYDGSNFYLDRVKRDQRVDLFWRENYLDFGIGDWEFRVGAQNVVWGEVAGLFFADVVSARDLREFLLPSFDVIRIPQWAARAEYFAGDSKFELLWIPAQSFDNIGKPGSDFYPVPLPSPTTSAVASAFRDPVRPDRKLSNSSLGARATTLVGGWDLSAFIYRSFSSSPTFYRLSPQVVEPRYDRITQTGATVSKDLGSFVLRAEAVYANGLNFATRDPAAAQGVVDRRTLDWIVSAETPLQSVEGRVNLQVFKRHYLGGSADLLVIDTGGIGVGLLASVKLTPAWEPSVHLVHVFDGGGSMIRPKLTWYAQRNLSLALGADLFSGSRDGLFGRFVDRDRAYLEARYSF